MRFSRIVRDEDLAGLTVGQILNVTKALTMILSLPQSAADHVDAIVIASGQGEEWRFTHAIRRWEANPDLRYLLVANGNPAERTYVEITPAYLRSLGLRRIAGVFVQAEPAPNTALQATWIVNQVRDHGITSLGLALTVLKAFDKSGMRIPIIPIPVAVSPDTPVPETGATAYDLVPGEAKRILTCALPRLIRGSSGWGQNSGRGRALRSRIPLNSRELVMTASQKGHRLSRTRSWMPA
jgi:hypothetical protein